MNIREKNTETYDKIAAGYSSTHFDHFWVEEFAFFKKNISGNKVIDIGCGAGRDASVFVENNFDYTGIDASAGMLKVAAERVLLGKFIKSDFSSIGFSEGFFDGFWAAASLLHVPKKEIFNVFRELKRITKVGGIGFISVKEKNGIDEGLIQENKYGGISRYFSFYTKDEFKKLLEESGFTVLKIMTHMENDEQKTNWLCYFVKI